MEIANRIAANSHVACFSKNLGFFLMLSYSVFLSRRSRRCHRRSNQGLIWTVSLRL